MTWQYSENFFPHFILDKITDIRVHDSGRALRVAKRRQKRKNITENGRLTILAANHPAQGITKVRDNPLAMANRRDYLMRIVRILAGNAVDGLMASMDVLEELLIIHDWIVRADGPPLLDHKVMIPSLNPQCFSGFFPDMEDAFTGPSPEACREWNMDGAKIFLRICDSGSSSSISISQCAQLITQLDAMEVVPFLMPFLVLKGDDGYRIRDDARSLAQTIGVASALGSSKNLWLQTPYCSEYELVARSTTLPILLIGGDVNGEPLSFMQNISTALKCAKNVRGMLVGRNVLYPGNQDPLLMARAVDGIIHRDWTMEQVKQSLSSNADFLEGLEWPMLLAKMKELAEDRWFTFEGA